MTQTTRVKNASVQTAKARRKLSKRNVKLYNEFLNVEVDFDPQNSGDRTLQFTEFVGGLLQDETR